MNKKTEQPSEEGIEIIKEKETQPEPVSPMTRKEIEDILAPFIGFLNAMRTTKGYITSAPIDTPKNFYDSIRFYDTGGVRRLYLYINGAWRYVVLT